MLFYGERLGPQEVPPRSTAHLAHIRKHYAEQTQEVKLSSDVLFCGVKLPKYSCDKQNVAAVLHKYLSHSFYIFHGFHTIELEGDCTQRHKQMSLGPNLRLLYLLFAQTDSSLCGGNRFSLCGGLTRWKKYGPLKKDSALKDETHKETQQTLLHLCLIDNKIRFFYIS